MAEENTYGQQTCFILHFLPRILKAFLLIRSWTQCGIEFSKRRRKNLTERWFHNATRSLRERIKSWDLVENKKKLSHSVRLFARPGRSADWQFPSPPGLTSFKLLPKLKLVCLSVCLLVSPSVRPSIWCYMTKQLKVTTERKGGEKLREK